MAVASPEIADVVPISDRQIYVLGKKIGSTNVMLYDQQKSLIGVLDVDVQLDTSAMSIKVRQGSGGRGIRVGEVNGNVVLTGDAGDGQDRRPRHACCAGLAPEGKNVVNALSVSSPQQVLLQVRFVEASRPAVRNLGVRWDAFWRNGRSGAVVGQQNSGSKFATTGNTGGVADTVAGLAPFGEPFRHHSDFDRQFQGGQPGHGAQRA